MSELVSPVSLSFVAGDDLLLEFTVTDADDEVVNITGMTARFVVVRQIGDSAVISTEAVPATATATLTTPASGIFQVEVDAAVTANLSGTYRFQAEVEDGSGDKSTVSRGYITFESDAVP